MRAKLGESSTEEEEEEEEEENEGGKGRLLGGLGLPLEALQVPSILPAALGGGEGDGEEKKAAVEDDEPNFKVTPQG